MKKPLEVDTVQGLGKNDVENPFKLINKGLGFRLLVCIREDRNAFRNTLQNLVLHKQQGKLGFRVYCFAQEL